MRLHHGLLALVLVSGCAGELIGAYDPGNLPPVLDDAGKPVPQDMAQVAKTDAEVGRDTDGAVNPCPPGQHKEGDRCVYDELTCAAEFPCPEGQLCQGGRCVIIPGPCASNDDCPVGNICNNGVCQPLCGENPQCLFDSDCGIDNVCVNCTCQALDICTKPTADLTGMPWTAQQVLHIDEALGSFGKTMVGILKKLRDGIMGCPKGSSAECFLYEIIASFLPQWAQTLIVAFGNFGDLLDNHNFNIDSTMSFSKGAAPNSYLVTDQWNYVSFSYQNMLKKEKPENIPQIGKPVVLNFTASAVCHKLYVDKHKVEGVLSGILKWIVDTVVEVATCGGGGQCYHNLGEALLGAINCGAISNVLAKAACSLLTGGLSGAVDNALSKWLLDYSLMTLKGTADVNQNGKQLENGKWDGTLGGGSGVLNNFDGEWSATR